MALRFRGTAILLCLVLGRAPGTAAPAHAQSRSERQQLAGTRSVGDAVKATDAASETRALGVSVPSVHILYVHGIGQIGAGDSAMLRKAICKYEGACEVTALGRLYAAGPFTAAAQPPAFTYMGARIWNSPEGWSASAPFLDRYRITGGGNVPILLDELNWWPVVYPLKCRAVIVADAHLTGPEAFNIGVCAAPKQADPDHAGRYLAYPWISASQAAALRKLRRHASFLNRSLKNSVLDWGFSDAVMALGPLEQVLKAAIRELLVQSLHAAAVDPGAAAHVGEKDPQFFFITHSLGSYLTLASLDADWLGDEEQTLPEFRMTAEQRSTAEYFSAHTAGFYFLANQLEFLELARVRTAPAGTTETACPAMQGSKAASGGAPSAEPAATSINDWRCRRLEYLQAHGGHGPNLLGPQIIAWSDPDDLLTWNVPDIPPVRVVNLHVRNPGFKLPPLLVWPTGAHANYAENRKVLRIIFRPTPKS